MNWNLQLDEKDKSTLSSLNDSKDILIVIHKKKGHIFVIELGPQQCQLA